MGVRFISDRPSWRRGAAAFTVALLCVLLIALLQRSGSLDGLNVGGMRLAGSMRQDATGVTSLMVMASIIGGNVGRFLIVGLAVVALLWAGRRSAARWFVLVMAGGTLLNFALKQIFAAPRPDLLPHLDIVHSYSFPSGHSAGNMMLFGALAVLAGKASVYVLAALAIGLIGISRVWLGVHWPTDVLAGWTEGLGWLIFCSVWKPQADPSR